MSGLYSENATTGTDETLIVISDGYTAKCGDSSGPWAQVTDGYELRVTTQCSSSTIRVRKGTPQHFNGTVGTTPATITPTDESISILIYNPSSNSGNDLIQVSFDSGSNWFDIERKATLEIEAEVNSFQIKSNNAGTSYQMLVTYKDC